MLGWIGHEILIGKTRNIDVTKFGMKISREEGDINRKIRNSIPMTETSSRERGKSTGNWDRN
jgi:hypothetical protein